MKKIIALCSMIVALGFITGCGGGTPTPATNPNTDAVTTDSGDTEETNEGQGTEGGSDE